MKSNKYVSFRDFKSKYLCEGDITLETLNNFLNKLGFKTSIITLNIKDHLLFVDNESYLNLKKEIYEKTFDISSINNIYGFILNYQIRQLKVLRKPLDEIKEILIMLKKYHLTINILDCILNFLIEALEKHLKKEYNITPETNPDIFISHKITLTSSNLVSMIKKNKPLYGHELTNKDLLNKLDKEDIKKIEQRLDKLKCPKSHSDNPQVIAIQKLIWLHDANNYFIDIIGYDCDMRVRKLLQKDITSSLLCSIPFQKILNLNIDEIINEANKHKLSKEQTKHRTKKYEFPLEGMVASQGNFEGVAKVLNLGDDPKGITKEHIMVAKETTPNLVIGMSLCRGIITEKGGVACHAAIVSRELGKPCVVSVKGCMELIKEGDYLQVINGKIYKK